MLILALKIGQRLYISPAIGNRLIVEVVDLVPNCFGDVRVRLEIKTDLSKKNHRKPSIKDYQEDKANFTKLNALNAASTKSDRTTGWGQPSQVVAHPTLSIQQEKPEVLS